MKELTPEEIRKWRNSSVFLPEGGQEAVTILLDMLEKIQAERDEWKRKALGEQP